ncbi:ABC transporter permease [Leeuwenhoekiella palythoae]|uniref:ABC transport system permease protein n=1 Tax=Leeuwenhoekiella palythoae TaxID=573501 RepID=A0A1M5ZDG0_9FLAO|nr:ABC transporter permease [Leeuwenhoekiella palythoae]RXG28008.1 putative ABC transport system permease protein [Leeuwenhoekiella palythoae]UBZ09283.1 ABC transporter permease [Leeuwenhoekiella palythoae]SHI22222.1 putative ABC transport system permease protein [Leeuwenhoekiella palythoae]
MLIYLRVLKESLAFAINALRNNKLRTLLSLLGVTIGIFSIIGVLAAVDSLKQEIKGSLASLDNNTIIIMRFSFAPTDIPQWKREQFPDVSYDEYQYIKRNVPDVEAASFSLNVGAESIKYGDKLVTGVNIIPVTDGYYNIEALQLTDGRFFNESESNSGSNVLVLGQEIAESLFGSLDPIGKQVRLYGQRFSVIGVLEKEGSSMFGPSKDGMVILPVNVVRRIYGSNNKSAFPQIVVKPAEGVDIPEFNAVLEQRLRQLRGLKPNDVSNFFINQLSGFTDLIDNITGTMSTIGGFIGLFSLLVGGFGIANIMFVSVKERTNLIGIQKALGAKNRFILLQFLFESVILATIGGLIGLGLVWIIAQVMSQFTGDFQFVLSATNIFYGLSSSIVIGLFAGIVPAFMASRLDPVEAIRTGM